MNQTPEARRHLHIVPQPPNTDTIEAMIKEITAYGPSEELLSNISEATPRVKAIIEALGKGEIDPETAINLLSTQMGIERTESGVDLLTGALRKDIGEKALLREASRALREPKEPLTLAMVDLDRFKRLNDRYGHQAGDAVLQATGGYLLASLRRTTDIVVRFGGEEFLIGLPKTPEKVGFDLMDRTRMGLSAAVHEAIAEFDIPKIRRPITISIGISELPLNLNDPKKALDAGIQVADQRLYLSKTRGRNMTIGSVQAA